MKVSNLFFLLLFSPVYWSAFAQQSSPGKENDLAGVNARGDQGMGFSHEKTTHHFHLPADGGAIEIQSNEPTDAASQEAIRQHLAMIAVKGKITYLTNVRLSKSQAFLNVESRSWLRESLLVPRTLLPC